jgi:ABC-type uncharacterized transport system YnjBCD permease subunit
VKVVVLEDSAFESTEPCGLADAWILLTPSGMTLAICLAMKESIFLLVLCFELLRLDMEDI